jgi:hypothetical protein
MPLLLRKITRSHWSLPPDWQIPTEPCADSLKSLQSAGGALSLWDVSNELTNLDSVIVALASNCDYVPVVDWCVVPRHRVTRLGIVLVPEASPTPALQANKWHVNATGLTAKRLGAFAHVIFSTGTWGRKTCSQVKQLLTTAAKAGAVDLAMMKPSLLKDLGLQAPG